MVICDFQGSRACRTGEGRLLKKKTPPEGLNRQPIASLVKCHCSVSADSKDSNYARGGCKLNPCQTGHSDNFGRSATCNMDISAWFAKARFVLNPFRADVPRTSRPANDAHSWAKARRRFGMGYDKRAAAPRALPMAERAKPLASLARILFPSCLSKETLFRSLPTNGATGHRPTDN